jgi:hypothetical protein
MTCRRSAIKMLCMSAAKGKIIPSRATVRPGAWLVSLLLVLAVVVASPALAKMPHAPGGRTGENALAGTAAVTGGGSVFNAPALQNPGTVNFSGDPYGFQYGNLSQSPGAGGGEFAGGPLTAGSAALRSVYTAAAGVYGAVQGSTSAVNAVNDFQSGNTLGGSLNAAFSALNFGGVGFSAAYPAQSITGYVDNTGNLVDPLASSAPVSAVPRTVSLNVLNPEFTPAAAVTAARIENVAQTAYSYAVNNPSKMGLARTELGTEAEIQAPRTLRRWAQRNGIQLGEGGLRFQVRGASSKPDVIFDPAQKIFDFKLAPTSIRPVQTENILNNFPGYSLQYIYGPDLWR